MSYQQHEAGKDAVEDNRDRSAQPPFGGIETHPHHVADHHDAEVDATKPQEMPSQGTAGHNETPLSLCEVEAHLDGQEDDEALTWQEPVIGQKAGRPCLHGRQKRDGKERDEHVTQNAQAKQA